MNFSAPNSHAPERYMTDPRIRRWSLFFHLLNPGWSCDLLWPMGCWHMWCKERLQKHLCVGACSLLLLLKTSLSLNIPWPKRHDPRCHPNPRSRATRWWGAKCRRVREPSWDQQKNVSSWTQTKLETWEPYQWSVCQDIPCGLERFVRQQFFLFQSPLKFLSPLKSRRWTSY